MVWETCVPIGPTGSDVILKVAVDSSASGQWRVAADCPDTIKSSQKKGWYPRALNEPFSMSLSGIIQGGQMEIPFFTETSDEAAFEVDVAFCKGEACHLRYYRLLVHPKRSETAGKISIVSFTPTIDNL